MKNILTVHPNCRPHNWITYWHHNKSLRKFQSLIIGEVYDLGAGSAVYREWCLDIANNIAVDWSNSSHDGKIDIVADLNTSLAIESETADTVICFSVLEHLAEPQAFIHEVSRILKPGAALLLQVPWQWWIHEEPYDYFRFSPFALKLLLERAGLDSVQVTAQGGFFTTCALKINYFSLRFVKGPHLVRSLLRSLFWIPWQISQLAALVFDLMDLHPELEAHAYFVTAKRKSETQQGGSCTERNSTSQEVL